MTTTTTSPASRESTAPLIPGPRRQPLGRPVKNSSSTLSLVVVCVTTAMLMLDIAVVNTALPTIASELGTGLQGVQWVVDAYTLALAATVLTAGSVADRLGRRRLLVAGLVLFTLASLGCAAAGTIGVLEAARAVQGLGAAVLFAVSLAVLGHAFPDAGARAKALAVYGATIGASFAVGPLVGGLLTQGLDWRWIFLVNVPVGALCLALTLRGVEESRDPHARRVDWAGQLLLTGALFLLVLGLVRGGAEGWSSTPIVASLAAAAALLVAFVAVEARVAEPMLPLGMFADRLFTGTQVAAFAISSSLFAVFLYMTLYLQGVLHLSPVEAGAVYLPGTVVMFVAAGATAQLLDRLSAGVALCGSLLVVAGGMGLSLLAGPHSSWVVLLPGTVVSFAGAGVFNPVMSGLVLSQSDSARAGLAAGINDSFRQVGIALGVAVLGTFVPAASAFGADPEGYVTGLHHALLVSVAVAVAGAVVAALFVRRPRG
ncbi:EmrB/QacA subfamily drug resistance transporter [Motilibacter peucedani]|uniref:EmrB/QacA subfamily drug resistance transporter n=1 Tax=Motilibacter peucedani TaxID=598650 RepID=A0A420XR56_9ACTN|nr:MFS transporter [Motilibacter peucedani]RKS75692.1 EmrB/QacA subfamily drug resistance transporter [Motilibacter peucedani]